METIFLWPNEMPNGNTAKRKSLQETDTTCNVKKLTEVTDPSIVVFKSDESINNGIGILICPGGSYTILAIDLEGYEIAQWLNKLGYTAYVIQYRVPNNQKGALNDLQRAIKIIRSNSKFNHTQLGIIGFSAGGNLCARASISPSKDSYSGIDEIDSISSRPDFTLLIYPAYLDQGIHNSLSPDLVFDKNTPPMFVFGTEDDPHFNSSMTIAEALEKSKVPFEFHTLQKGGHGYGLRQGNKAAETWAILAEAWLNKITKKTR
jgi:acetyl esterase/lipase